MKKYLEPHMDYLEIEMIDVLMSSTGISTDNSVFGFDVDVNGGDEIW